MMSHPEQKRLHAHVHGRVQGVSFRHHTVQQARELSLTGWVTNREDRTVEVVAEGEKEALESFLRWLHRGPGAARVERVEATWSDATGEFVRFQIEYYG